LPFNKTTNMKINQETVEDVIRNTITDPAVAATIIQQITERAEQELAEARANAPEPDTSDKRNVVILLCAEGDVAPLREFAERTTAIAVQIAAEDNHLEVVSSILTGGAAYNDTKRRANLRVQSFAEACEVVSPKKHLNGFPKKIYTKEPALIVVSTNLPIPTATPTEELDE